MCNTSIAGTPRAIVAVLMFALAQGAAADARAERELGTDERIKLREMRQAAQGAYEANKPTDLSAVPTDPKFAANCMAAWTYLGKDAIVNRQGTLMLGEEFTEANAAWHWQHYLPGAISKYTPDQVKAFYEATGKAEQAIAELLRQPEGKKKFFARLGQCYRPPTSRQIRDPDLILRNYLVIRQILPPQAGLQPQQLQQFTQTVQGTGNTGLNSDIGFSACAGPLRRAKARAIEQCAAMGGYPLDNPVQTSTDSKTDLSGRQTCLATAELACTVY